MSRKLKSRKRQRQHVTTTASHYPGEDNLAKKPRHSAGISPSKIAPSISSSQNVPIGRKFLTAQDVGFEKYLAENYQGFVHLPATTSDHRSHQSDFHQFAKKALEKLRDANYYQYDIVMAGGKHSSRTFVKRTLVGDPGITYKYLGLRLFAHAWAGPNTNPLMQSICLLNQKMIQMTKQLPNHGKCDYNLTLINYMEPTSHKTIGFKEEADYGMGKVSVSWHADSSLESGSSIGVYHCLPTQRAAKWDWKIALRPSPESNIYHNVLPVAVDTKDGDTYFLLGNMNDNYQHCVLAGSQANRISSTHRVAVTIEDTYDYILKRVKIARKRLRLQLERAASSLPQSLRKLDAKIIRYCQKVITEVEMEWIAQYWLQGIQHNIVHTWWQRPMKTLEAYWRVLEELNFQLYQLCVHQERSLDIPTDVVKVLISEFKERFALRLQWDQRRDDKIYRRRISVEYQPVARPVFFNEGHDNNGVLKNINLMPKDLTIAIKMLSGVLKESASLPNSDPYDIEKNAEKSDVRKRKWEREISKQNRA